MTGHPCDVSNDGIINFRGEQGVLMANCKAFSFKGINWYGSEGINGVLEGLNHFSMSHYFDFLREHKFNAMRFLFNHESVLNDAPIPTLMINPIKNPELIDSETGHGIPYVEMIKVTAQAAAEKDVLVVIAAHRLTPDGWPGNGLWYSDQMPESRVKESWTKLANALCGQWNVVAVDLQNEPHKATWGQGVAATRWDLAAKRLGDHVLSVCPRWLVFVEGIAVGAPEDGGPEQGYWWGENLVGARSHPISLNDPSKLVYSPHTYGPSTYMQTYFKERGFPSNMPSVWGRHFLDATHAHSAPVVIGEFGGRGQAREDIAWQRKAIAYFPTQKVGMFYFCLNPTSEDTGGILEDNWYTPVYSKLNLLHELPSTDVASLRAMRAAPHPPPSPPCPPPPSPHPPPPPFPLAAQSRSSSSLPSILEQPEPASSVPPPSLATLSPLMQAVQPSPSPPVRIHVIGAETDQANGEGIAYAGRPLPDPSASAASQIQTLRQVAIVSAEAAAAILVVLLIGFLAYRYMRPSPSKGNPRRKQHYLASQTKPLPKPRSGSNNSHESARTKQHRTRGRISNADELAQLTAGDPQEDA